MKKLPEDIKHDLIVAIINCVGSDCQWEEYIDFDSLDDSDITVSTLIRRVLHKQHERNRMASDTLPAKDSMKFMGDATQIQDWTRQMRAAGNTLVYIGGKIDSTVTETLSKLGKVKVVQRLSHPHYILACEKVPDYAAIKKAVGEGYVVNEYGIYRRPSRQSSPTPKN